MDEARTKMRAKEGKGQCPRVDARCSRTCFVLGRTLAYRRAANHNPASYFLIDVVAADGFSCDRKRIVEKFRLSTSHARPINETGALASTEIGITVRAHVSVKRADTSRHERDENFAADEIRDLVHVLCVRSASSY